MSFTLIDNGVTTSQNLNAVDFQDDKLGYFGGNSGVLLRYYNGSITRLSVADSSGSALSGNINVVRTPPTRGNEVYLGTSGGEVWRSRNATNTRPTYQNLSLPGKGSGTITDLAFVGYQGYQMYVLQTNASNLTRVLRDHSGGALNTDVEFVGDYNTPGNFRMNSIAMANVNFGLTVGQVHETYGFIGQIRPNS